MDTGEEAEWQRNRRSRTTSSNETQSATKRHSAAWRTNSAQQEIKRRRATRQGLPANSGRGDRCLGVLCVWGEEGSVEHEGLGTWREVDSA